MNNIMFLASTQNQHSNKRSPRPDSPGGYFTLSDSDGGSNPGTESSSMDDLELPSHSKNSMYKMYTRGRSEPPRGSSGGSERSSLGSEPPAPQRPSPPKTANEDDDTPPRPPPPLSYTSTLPPPVPKKVNKRINPPNGRRFNPPPPPLTHFGPKTKPLQRVQPLQIQSPSMIQMLQPKCGGGMANNSTSSSDDNSLDGVVAMKKPVTFVTTFQRATSSMKDSAPNLKTRPPLKCEQQAKNNNNKKKMSSRPSSGTAEVAGYMKPTKTAVLKQNNDINGKQKMSSSGSNSENESDKNKKKTARRSASSSSSLSDTNTSTETESSKMTVKKKTRPKTANDGNNNTSSKLKKLKNSVCNELKRSASDKAVPVKKTKASSIKSLSKSEANVNKASSKPMKNPIHSLIKFYESSQEKDKMKEKMVVLEDKLIHENKMDRMSSTSQLSQLSQMSAEKIQTWLSNPLSMTHDEFSVTDISILDQYVTDMISLADVTPNVITNKSQSESDDDYPRVIKKSDLLKSQNKSPKSPRSSSKVKSEKSSKVTNVKEKEKSSKSLEKSPKSTKARLKSQKVNVTEKNRSSNASSKESKKPPSNITPSAEKSPSNVCEAIEKIFIEVTNNVSEKFPKVSNVTDVTEKIINVTEKPVEIIDVQPSDALIKKWQIEKNQLSNVTKTSDSANHNSSDITKKQLTNITKHQSSDVTKSDCTDVSENQPVISKDIPLSSGFNSSKSKPRIAERYNIYNKDYSITEKNTEITVLEDKIPSEEEIQRGCFTEVSCAGNVTTKTSFSSSSSSTAIKEVKRVDFAPIPSPRVKKKARKEQMLLEHKEKGHDALAMVMKHLTKPEDECSKPEHSTETELATANDGLQCLDDLCSQSRFIEEDIKKQAKITDEPTKNQNDQPKQQQKEEVGVCLIIVFLICHSDHLNQSFKGLGS